MSDVLTEIRDGMQIDWDVPVTMDDGVVLRADVFRPVGGGTFPALLTYGPYAKGLAFQEGYPSAWQRMAEQHPDVTAGSSNKYQNWEVVDPEKWVPHGYACVRVDSRGCGRSPGFEIEYSNHLADTQRWFLLRASPLGAQPLRGPTWGTDAAGGGTRSLATNWGSEQAVIMKRAVFIGARTPHRKREGWSFSRSSSPAKGGQGRRTRIGDYWSWARKGG